MPLRKYLEALLWISVLILTAEIPLQAQDIVIAGLKGKVQTVLTEEFTSKDGISREPSGSTLDVYDSAGYKLQSFLYKSDGSLWAHTVYDRNGPRIFRVDVTGVPDNDGTRIAPFEPYSEQFVYDAKGRGIETDMYDPNGVLVSKSTNTVIQDQPNSTVMYQTDRRQGVESTSVTTETTDPQSEIEHQVTTKTGQVSSDWVLQWNPDGTEKDKIVYGEGSYTEREKRSDGTTVQNSYNAPTKAHSYIALDAHGHVVETIGKSASYYYRNTYSFDEAGRPTGQISYDASGNVVEKSTAEYRNDSRGNWVEKKSIEWNTKAEPMQPKSVTLSLRTINYY